MDILNVTWTVLSFLLGLLWWLVWFVLRDLISTLLWVLIVAWLLLSVRFRSFGKGSIALLRYARHAANVFWRWLRSSPSVNLPVVAPPPPKVITKEVVKEVVKVVPVTRKRRPFGTVGISEQLNMLLVGAVYLLFFN